MRGTPERPPDTGYTPRSMPLVAVTGPSGHVGANLVRMLLARGHAVRVLVRREAIPALAGLDVELVKGDVREPASVARLVDGASAVFHAAGIISIAGDPGGLVEQVNVRGTAHVADAALAAGVKMIYFCSIHAFEQAPLTLPIDESRARVVKGTAYDRSKANGEAEVRKRVAKGLDAMILHPSGILGPHDFGPSRMGRVFLDLYRRRVPALVPGGADWVDVRDVVETAINAWERGKSGESYIVTGRWASMGELAMLAAEVTGVAPPRLETPLWLARAGASVVEAWARVRKTEPLYTRESLSILQANRAYVSAKATRELGHAPRPLHESVRDAHRWFAESGVLPKSLLRRFDAV
jgi:dihydroflavonol-4-reductase